LARKTKTIKCFKCGSTNMEKLPMGKDKLERYLCRNCDVMVTVVHSHTDHTKPNYGLLFDNFGKCPKCGSTNSGLKSTLEEQSISGTLEYECLMCGAQWQELLADHPMKSEKEV